MGSHPTRNEVEGLLTELLLEVAETEALATAARTGSMWFRATLRRDEREQAAVGPWAFARLSRRPERRRANLRPLTGRNRRLIPGT